jgi:hypothetical protein
MRHILLKRQGKNITDFDLYDLIVFGDKSKDVQLLSGDVIHPAFRDHSGAVCTIFVRFAQMV